MCALLTYLLLCILIFGSIYSIILAIYFSEKVVKYFISYKLLLIYVFQFSYLMLGHQIYIGMTHFP